MPAEADRSNADTPARPRPTFFTKTPLTPSTWSGLGQSRPRFKMYHNISNISLAASRCDSVAPKVERYNGTLWTTIQLALHTMNMNQCNWQSVLPDALHSVRSLLCTTTNTTPHERMFTNSGRSGVGLSAPSWLLNPGPVLLKRINRMSKYKPIVDEVTLIHGNVEYAHVKLSDGRETTVSTRYLAPVGESSIETHSHSAGEEEVDHERVENMNINRISLEVQPNSSNDETSVNEYKRSMRPKYRPAYLKDYVT